MEITQTIINAILTLDEEYRKSFFMRALDENKAFFILREKAGDNAPLMLEDNESESEDEVTTFMPVWSNEEFVNYYLDNSFSGNKDDFELYKMDLEFFNEKWAKFLDENHIALAIMPLDSKDFCFEKATALADGATNPSEGEE